jgi:predicted adenine nucleotide alpha hydrolase (AANH) superfamily ATPase
MSENLGLIAGMLLAVALLVYTFWPENVFAAQKPKSRLEYLRERKEQVDENLRDLSFEFSAGKYPQEDFAAQKKQLEDESAKLVAEMELSN